MSNFLQPNLIFDNIYEINHLILKENNIKTILIDLDGTMESSKTAIGNEELGNWVQSIKENGISVFVMSNNNEERVKIFCKPYNLSYLSRAKKPLKSGYLKVFETLKINPYETAMIGDQIFTDVFGGNRHGMFTIFIHSIDRNRPFNKMRNILERPFIKQKGDNK